MERITQALEYMKRWKLVQASYIATLERYLITGDEAALASITPFGQQGSHIGYTLADAMRPPRQWGEEDRRVVRALVKMQLEGGLSQWMNKQLMQEKPEEDFLALLAKEIPDSSIVLDAAVSHLSNYQVRGRPTSAGRLILSSSPDALTEALKRPTSAYYRPLVPLTDLMIHHAPQMLPGIADALLLPGRHGVSVEVAKLLLAHDGRTFELAVVSAFEQEKKTWPKFRLGQVLYDHDPKKFAAPALAVARASLRGSSATNNHGPVGTWMIDKFGHEVLPDIIEYFTPAQNRPMAWAGNILNDAVRVFGKEAMPVVLRGLQQSSHIRKNALNHLIRLDADSDEHHALIRKHLDQGLESKDADEVVTYIGMAAKWNAAEMAEPLWNLFEHKSKLVRSAAARALGKSGDAAIARAGELLKHKKADVRSAAVTLLASAATPGALMMLEARLDEEASEDVRDQMLLGLSAAWAAQGRKLTRKDVEARITKTVPKLKEPPAIWAAPDKLPPLKWKDGDTLSEQAVAYLIYRQSRARDIAADVEAAPMYELIDRASSGEFARTILKGFLASKQDAEDKWALALVGLLGDDRVVPDLVAQVRDWVDHNRGKLAEYAVKALALIGTDAALLAVDAMAIRYRSKMKNVGKAAAEAFIDAAAQQGITPEELGDRVVPWLGFERGKPRIIEAGKTKIAVTIGPDLKFAFKDLEKNKPIKSLPKTAPKEVLDEFKDLSANLKEVIKAQLLRLENLLVRQRRWPAGRWKELFLEHPLLLPFATRLVWGHYDDAGKRIGTFRALEDRTLTTNTDDAYALGDSGVVGMIHPLELSEDERAAWQNHLADYEIEPPFPQLARDVVACDPQQAKLRVLQEVSGKSLNAMTFKGRAERLGWYRGSVVDGGCIASYFKSFPAAGCDVFLGIDDFYIGIDMYSNSTLGDVLFCKHGSVTVGSYTYDEPSDPNDARVIALGEVHPIVFSEVMADLQKIAGAKEGEQAEGDA